MRQQATIETVAIVGAGLVGSAWSVIFSLAGLQVRVYDADPGMRSKVLDQVSRAQVIDLARRFSAPFPDDHAMTTR